MIVFSNSCILENGDSFCGFQPKSELFPLNIKFKQVVIGRFVRRQQGWSQVSKQACFAVVIKTRLAVLKSQKLNQEVFCKKDLYTLISFCYTLFKRFNDDILEKEKDGIFLDQLSVCFTIPHRNKGQRTPQFFIFEYGSLLKVVIGFFDRQ